MMGPVIPNVEEFKRRFGVWRVCTGFGMIEIGFPAEGLTRRNRVQSEDLAGGSFPTRNDFW